MSSGVRAKLGHLSASVSHELYRCAAMKRHCLVTKILSEGMLITLNILLPGILIFKTRDMWEE